MKTKNKISQLYALHAHHERTLRRAFNRWEKSRALIERIERKADKQLLAEKNTREYPSDKI